VLFHLYPTVGVLIASRPHEAVGWMLCAGGFAVVPAHVSLWLEPSEKTRNLKNFEKPLS
jgi:hypothetical protein